MQEELTAIAQRRSVFNKEPALRSAAVQLCGVQSAVCLRRSCFQTHSILHHKPETAETLRGFKHVTAEAQRTRLQTFLQIVRRVSLQDITLVHISLRACSLNDEMFKSLVDAAGVVPSCSFFYTSISCNNILWERQSEKNAHSHA
jgi:hypothetical protein